MRTKPGASEELGWGNVALTAVSITSGWDDGCRVNGALGSTRKLRAAAGCAQAGRCSCPERRLPPLHPTAASSQPSLRWENPATSPTARFVYMMESKTGVADPDVHDWTFTPSSLQGEAEPALASAVGWEVALPRGARLGGEAQLCRRDSKRLWGARGARQGWQEASGTRRALLPPRWLPWQLAGWLWGSRKACPCTPAGLARGMLRLQHLRGSAGFIPPDAFGSKHLTEILNFVSVVMLSLPFPASLSSGPFEETL